MKIKLLKNVSVDAFGLQKLLGHRSQAATQIYADVGKKHLEEKVFALEQSLQVKLIAVVMMKKVGRYLSIN